MTEPRAATQKPATNVDPGLTLCLSGGGFRATLFHLGSLRRLNEFGVLANVKVITSVSGGSILNGILATRWSKLQLDPQNVFTNFDEEVGSAVRAFCSRDLRTPLLLGTRLNLVNLPALIRDGGAVSGNFLADKYEPIMQRQLLRDLPAPGPHTPRFVFCSTRVHTGACWHFHGGPDARMGDFYTGYCPVADTKVSTAVAASSAFPPGFGALHLPIPDDVPLTRIDPWNDERGLSVKRKPQSNAEKRRVLLTDGGVYDNLGVEPVWERSRTLLVSDAGMPFGSVASAPQHAVGRLFRAFEIGAEQMGAVRKRWLVDRFAENKQWTEMVAAYPALASDPRFKNKTGRSGTIWAINTQFYPRETRGYGADLMELFSGIRTDLNSFNPGEIACLENHGYALADAALRKHGGALCPNAAQAFNWPHPDWADEQVARNTLASSGERSILTDVWKMLTGG